MSRRLALLALVLAPALARAQAPAAPEAPKCEFAVEFIVPKRAFPADDPLCVTMRGYKRVFERLREAASLGPEVAIFPDPVRESAFEEANAGYMRESRSIFVNWAYLQRFEPDSPAAARTLAHELGHAVQDRDGVLPVPADGESMTDFLARRRRAEAHADLIGRELMERAGYPVATMMQQAIEERFGCERIQRERFAFSHPTAGSRWLNAVRANAPVDPRDAGRRFDGSGDAAPYEPSVSIGDFDEQGRLPFSTRPILDPRVQPRPTLEDLAATPPPPPPPALRRPGAGPVRAAAFGPAPAATEQNEFLRFSGWTLDVARRVMVPRYAVVLPTRSDDEHIANVALRGCGAAPGMTYEQAVRYGLDELTGDLMARLRKLSLGLQKD